MRRPSDRHVSEPELSFRFCECPYHSADSRTTSILAILGVANGLLCLIVYMSLSPKTILVVDDEPGVLELIKLILSRQGYRILMADSGQKALEIGGQHRGLIDLLLTDVVMPGMSGFTLARGMRAWYQELPVLYMTGGTFDGSGEGELDRQSNLLRKPFDSQTLVHTVAGLLEAGQAEQFRSIESDQRVRDGTDHRNNR